MIISNYYQLDKAWNVDPLQHSTSTLANLGIDKGNLRESRCFILIGAFHSLLHPLSPNCRTQRDVSQGHGSKVTGGFCHEECEARHLDPVEQTRWDPTSGFQYPAKPLVVITVSRQLRRVEWLMTCWNKAYRTCACTYLHHLGMPTDVFIDMFHR